MRPGDGATVRLRPGGDARVAEFLHESDVAHDYLVLEGERELTAWSTKVAKQSDRYVLVTSASAGSEERALIRARLGQLTPTQLATGNGTGLVLGGVGLLKFENHRDVVRRGHEEAKPAVEAWVAARSERAEHRRHAKTEATVARMG